MIIKPKVRGFVCVTAHPAGCAAHVDEWIRHVKSKGPVPNGPRKALVIGASTGYGLASRITAASPAPPPMVPTIEPSSRTSIFAVS